MVAVNGGVVNLYRVKKTLKSIVPLEPTWVDMCINSCQAYTGKYQNHNECDICQTPRFHDQKHIPRRQMAYFSITDRLKIQYQDPKRSENLRYRANYTRHQDSDIKIGDIFDGTNYKKLVSKGFFQDDRDVALTGSVDGYQIFRQKTDDCWVVLMINANICPEERVKKENLMVTAIIPGPKEPKDFNSFMYPIIQNLKELEGNILLYCLIISIWH